MLLEAPNRSTTAASSPWRSLGSNRSCRSDRGCGIQWSFHRVVWKNYSTTTGLEGRIDAAMGTEFQHSWRALDPRQSTTRLSALEDQSEWISCVDEVSFKRIKDTFQCTRGVANFLLSCTYKSYYLFFTESIDGVVDSNSF